MDSRNLIIDNAVKVLLQGGTLLYPTDTIWGLGCDATNADAIDKIYALKERDHSKSMLILCADQAMVERFVCPLSAEMDSLLLSTRPTTVILPAQTALLPPNLLASDHTVGVRLPQTPLLQCLIGRLDRPLVSTSANFSGTPSPAGFDDINPRLKQLVSLCLPPSCEDPRHDRHSSRIVKLNADGSITTIRD